MSIVTKFLLVNPNDKAKVIGSNAKDIFIISEEIHRADILCNLLSKKINSYVCWYKSGDKAIICVNDKFSQKAIDFGKQIIIDEFDTMSENYISKVQTPVLENYSIIATAENDTIYELKKWCKEIDDTDGLLVKTNPNGSLAILTLTRYSDDFIPLIKKASSEKPEITVTYKKI